MPTLEQFIMRSGGRAKAAVLIGIAETTLWRWIQGRSQPRGLALRRLADLSITGISGVDAEKVWKTRVKGSYQGHSACYISRACLLENKRAADRGQDRLDVQKLEEQARLARRKKGRNG